MHAMTGASRKTRVVLLSWVPLFLWLLLPVCDANAYGSGQWEWKVVGLSGTYPTKAAAYAALLARGGDYQYLDKEEGISDLTGQWVTYKYSATPRDPVIQSEWDYSAGIYHFPTEAELYAAGYQNLAENYSDPECPPTLEPITDWYGGTFWGIPNSEWRDYEDYRGWWATNPTPHCYYDGPHLWQIHRTRSVGCEWPFTPHPTQQICILGTFGYITGHPLVCSRQCTKHPVDVSSGDKVQRETDYSGPALTFARTYHSQLAQSTASLGVGWTHNFSSKLIILSSPKGLVAADGFHEPLDSKSGYWMSRTGAVRVEQQGSEYIAYYENNSREVYSNTGRLLKKTAPNGQETVVAYDSSNRVSTITGPFGHTLTFAYATNGFVSSVTDPAGGLIQFSYDSARNLTDVLYPDVASREYHYENSTFPNHLTGITDENGDRYKTITYDSVGRVATSELAADQEIATFAYGANSTTVTDALDTDTTYSFTTTTTLHRVVTGISKGGNTRSWVVPSWATDSQRRPTQLTDERGVIYKYTYDAHHKTAMTEAFGTSVSRATSYQYLNDQSDLPTQLDEPNRRTTFTYSGGNMLTRTVTDLTVTPNVSRTWTYTYNGSGQVLTVNGPRTDVSDVAAFTYYACSSGDECGQVETITNALGHVTTYNTYNAHGQPLTITDPNGIVTTLTYGERQRLASREAEGETTTFDYWPTGLLKEITLPDGSSLEYTYDEAHRLTQVSDSQGNRIVYTLDAMGNRIREETFDPSDYLTRLHHRAFNTLNQLWKEIGSANTSAVTTTFGFDANSNQTSANAALGRNTSSLYDELNRLKQITDPASGITLFGYDPNDNLTSVTDPRGKVTSYVYTGFGDLKQQTSPDTGVTNNVYDSGGNLFTSTDARGKTGTYSYDALNRATQLSYPDQTITYSYDTGTNNKGRLMQVTDASGSTSWTYSSLGRTTSRTQVMSGVNKTVGYGYNSTGQLTTLTTPSGQTITYGYSNNRIASITVNSTTLLSNVLYDPFGPARQWTWGNSTLAIRTFDQDGNLDQLDSAGLRTYAQDDAFRITGITDAVNPNLTWSYGYDLLDRLTSASKTGQNQTWTYDANGNRLTQGGTTSSTFTISSSSNRLSGVSGAISRTYRYDAAGNTASYGGLTFTYNDAGRMTGVLGSATASYGHNALGQRVKKVAGGVTTYFVFDESGHLLGEYDGSGSLLQETIWLEDIPVATLRPNGGSVSIFQVHADHLNTPRRISRPSDNAILWRWDSDPFGADAASQDPDGDSNLFAYNLRFPGQYFDSETGLSYNYSRDYDSVTGRYIESDPIGLEGGISTYGYADASPTAAADPLGLKAEMCCRYLTSPLGAVRTRIGAVGLLQRHCFLRVDGTTYSLFPDGDIGRPERDNEFDKRSKARCKECKPKSLPCESTAHCLRKAHDEYAIGAYNILGPNSNTYAGTLAGKCCEGGVPPGMGSTPGIGAHPPIEPAIRFIGR